MPTLKPLRRPWRTHITAEEYRSKIKETGKNGLTSQVRDFLKVLEARYSIWWERNHQTLGTKRGRPDFEVFCYQRRMAGSIRYDYTDFIAIELKVGKGKLSQDQLREKERIERAGGRWFTCYSIENVAQIFLDLGMAFEIN